MVVSDKQPTIYILQKFMSPLKTVDLTDDRRSSLELRYDILVIVDRKKGALDDGFKLLGSLLSSSYVGTGRVSFVTVIEQIQIRTDEMKDKFCTPLVDNYTGWSRNRK